VSYDSFKTTRGVGGSAPCCAAAHSDDLQGRGLGAALTQAPLRRPCRRTVLRAPYAVGCSAAAVGYFQGGVCCHVRRVQVLLRRLLEAANDAATKAASRVLPPCYEVLTWASDKFVGVVMKPLYQLLPPDDPLAWAQLVAGGQPALERLVHLEPFEAAPQPAFGPSASAEPAVPLAGALGGEIVLSPCRQCVLP